MIQGSDQALIVAAGCEHCQAPKTWSQFPCVCLSSSKIGTHLLASSDIMEKKRNSLACLRNAGSYFAVTYCSERQGQWLSTRMESMNGEYSAAPPAASLIASALLAASATPSLKSRPSPGRCPLGLPVPRVSLSATHLATHRFRHR